MKVLLTATVQSHICQFHKPLVEILHAHGCEVHVAAKNNLAEKNGLKLDFVEKVYDVPFARSPKSKNNINAYREIKKIVNQEHYDVIHCNTPMGGIVTRLAARKVRKRGTKVYYTAHGFHFYEGAPKKNWIVFYPIEKIFSCLTDKLITITAEDFNFAKRKFYCQVERIHGVGVDEKRYFPVDKSEKMKLRKEMGFNMEQKIILCVGELLPNKNQKMAIHMMKYIVDQHSNSVLLLAGNGPERDDLEQEIEACRMNDHVKLLSYCTNLQDYQHIADVLVSCSKREGLPANIVEAMLSETPIVASRNRGHKELIQDGETGFLVDVNDTKDMAQKVLKILNDDELQKQISEDAKKYAEQYNYSNVKQELETIYFDRSVKGISRG